MKDIGRGRAKTVKNQVSTLCLLLLAVICLVWTPGHLIPYSHGLSILSDEFGYWGIAATIAGKNWQPLLALTPYYAYGYSLLLVPLYLLNLPVAVMYRAALCLNVVMLVISFFVAIRCISALFPKISINARILIAFTCNIYTCAVLQAQFAWGETLLWMLYWLICETAIDLFKAPTVGKSVLLASLCMFSFAVHLRTLGILVGAAISIVLAFVLKRIKAKHLLAFFVVFLAAALLVMFGHNLTEEQIYSISQNPVAAVTDNTIAGRISSAPYLLAPENIRNFLLGICGKLFYLATSTMLTGFIAIPFLFKQLGHAIICIKKKVEFHGMPWIFILFTAGAMFGINVFAAFYPWWRLDSLVYGRYMEFTFGPLIMLGLLLLLEGNIKSEHVSAYVVGLFFLGMITNDTLVEAKINGAGDFNRPMVIGWARFLKQTGANTNVMNFSFYMFAIAVTAFLAIWGGCRFMRSFYKRRAVRKQSFAKNRNFSAVLVAPILAAAVVWIYASWWETDMILLQDFNEQVTGTFHELSASRGDIEPTDILCVYSDINAVPFHLKFVQAEYPDITLRLQDINEYSADSVSAETLVVTGIDYEAQDQVAMITPSIAENPYLRIYAKPDSPWAEAMFWEKLLSIPVTFHVAQNGVDEMPIEIVGEAPQIENGTKGIHFGLNCTLAKSADILFGPYIQLPAGDYRVKFTLKYDDANKISGILASCSVTANSGGTVLSEKTVDTPSLSEASETEVWLSFSCTQLMENVEFVTRLAQDIKVEVVSIELQKA